MISGIFIAGKRRIRVPNDIEVRISHEPRITSIQTIPHSPNGERFAYDATEAERSQFLELVFGELGASLQEV